MIQSRRSAFVLPRTTELRVFGSALAPDDPLRGGVLMLGNFDGLHRGHRSLVALARKLSFGRPVGVMSCEPHPRALFGTEPQPFRLVTPDSKAQLLAAAGLDYVHQPRFDGAFAGQTPEAFVEQVLVSGLGVSHVVTGQDFRFGHKRAGDVALLRVLGQRFGFSVSVAPKLASGGGHVSSSRIRALIRSGQICAALDLLGGDWVIETTCGANGSLHMHETLCRPRPGRYRARLPLPTLAPIAFEIDIGVDGRLLPYSPLPTAGRHFFHIIGESV